MIHIDFVIDLPIDQNCTTDLTIVDHFSKMCMFIPLSSTTDEHVAQAFFQQVVTHHGLPHHNISEIQLQLALPSTHSQMHKLKLEITH